MPDPDTNPPADAAPEEEPLLDINGNPIPRNWNPGQAPPSADTPPPSAPKRPAGTRPPGMTQPGMTPPARPAYTPPPRPAAPPAGYPPPPLGDLAEEEVKYDLAGNPLPSNRPTGPLGGPAGPGGYGGSPMGGPARHGAYPPTGGGYGAAPAGGYGAPGGYGRAYTTSVNGGLILGLGIVGVMICGICAPIAWVLGNNAVGAIDRGEADPSQRGLANGGRIVGMIGTLFIILSIVVALIRVPGIIQQMREHQGYGSSSGSWSGGYGGGTSPYGTGASPYHGYGSPYGHSTPPTYTPPTYTPPPSGMPPHANNPFGHSGP